jgi:uncharacterized repeat protein (TIGR03833 family)
MISRLNLISIRPGLWPSAHKYRYYENELIHILYKSGLRKECYMEGIVSGKDRSQIKPGLEVLIVLKKDQQTGELTRGIVKDILTNSANHPHGIKVRLESGEIGRVQEIVGING